MRWAVAAAFLLWVSVLLRAETHPHAAQITYLAGVGSLDWTTQEFTEDEQVAKVNKEAWSIGLSARTMYDQKSSRKFAAEEAEFVAAELRKFAEIVAVGIVKAKPEEIVSLTWDFEKRRIDVAYQQNGLVTDWVDAEGKIHRENGAVEDVSEDAQSVLWDVTKKLTQYCLESVLWWRAGHGEKTEPSRAEVTHEAVLVAVGR